jgi:bacterioferritin-associated ferredoxin
VYICLCKGLTERDLEHCVRAGHTSAEALIAALGLDDPNTCGRCARGVDALVAATSGAAGDPSAPMTRGAVGTGAAGQGAPGLPPAGVLAGAVHGPRGRHSRDVQCRYLGRGFVAAVAGVAGTCEYGASGRLRGREARGKRQR